MLSSTVLFTAGSAHAKLRTFVEPYVGLGKVELDFENSAYGSFKDIANGFFLGLRGGIYLTEKFLVGLDYHSAGPFHFDDSINNAEWNHVMKGGGLGADYKVIRFWLGYYFDNEFEDETNRVNYLGTALKLGIGLLMNKKLRANLDFVSYSNRQQERYGNTTSVDGIGVVSTHVSISIPLDF